MVTNQMVELLAGGTSQQRDDRSSSVPSFEQDYSSVSTRNTAEAKRLVRPPGPDSMSDARWGSTSVCHRRILRTP